MCPVSTLWNEKVLKKNSALLYYSNKMMTFQLLFGQQDKRTRAFCLKWETRNHLWVEVSHHCKNPGGFCSKFLSTSFLQIYHLGGPSFNLSQIYFLPLAFEIFLCCFFIVCMGLVHVYHGVYMEVKAQILRAGSLPPLGTELRLAGLEASSFNTLTSLSIPLLFTG